LLFRETHWGQTFLMQLTANGPGICVSTKASIATTAN